MILNRQTYFLVFLFIIVTRLDLLCQFENYEQLSYQKEDGLSSSRITTLIQDKYGYMWVGTVVGLNRFNGYDFQVYRKDENDSTSIAGDYIMVLFLDSSGDIWAGTRDGGVSKYNYETDNFTNYSYNKSNRNSLSFNYVTDIIEDEENNIWVSTMDGLNLIDKNGRITHYRNESSLLITNKFIGNIKNLIPKNVYDWFEKHDQHILVSEQDLMDSISLLVDDKNKFNEVYSKVTSLTKYVDRPGSLKSNVILNLEPGLNNTIWIAYDCNGLGWFRKEEGIIKHIYLPDLNIPEITDNCAHYIHKHDSLLLISTKNGIISKLDLTSFRGQLLTKYNSDLNIFNMLSLEDNKVGVGIFNGIFTMDPCNESTIIIYPDDVNFRTTEEAGYFYQDNAKNIWHASNGLKLYHRKKRFVNYSLESKAPFNINMKGVSSILVDAENKIWIGYFSGGMDFIDTKIGVIQHFKAGINEYELGSRTVFDIMEDSKNNIWIGTYLGGLQMYNRKTQTFKSYRNNPKNPYSISKNDVRGILEDEEGNIWAATHGTGISILDVKSGMFSHIQAKGMSENTIADDWIFDIKRDDNGDVWVGSVKGLSKIESHSRVVTNFGKKLDDPKVVDNFDIINCICPDKKGNVWFGTENGLGLFLIGQDSVFQYTRQDGLLSSKVKGLVVDDEHNLWITTNDGLSKLNLEEFYSSHAFKLKHFNRFDGISSNEFYARATFKDKQGNIYLGHEDGFTMFNPGEIRDDTIPPQIYFSDFKLFNKSVPIISDDVTKDGNVFSLSKHINYLDNLTLRHDQNVITFEFVALGFGQSEENKYAYIMEGFDPDPDNNQEAWNYVGNKREATYTNLDPGNYTFKVKASNSDGYWSRNNKSINITVLRPWWKTNLAFFIYFLLVLTISFLIGKVIFDRINIRQNQKLLLKEREVDQLKIEFFMNISHEFRTPLTLILAPIENLIKKDLKNTFKNEFYLLQRNAKRLLRLTNQLLDLRSLETNTKKLNVKEGDLIDFIRKITDSFNYLAGRNNIKYSFEYKNELKNEIPGSELKCWYDEDIIEKVLYNLISNAFKYTPENGSISVVLGIDTSTENDVHKERYVLSFNPENIQTSFVEIRIQDSGFGINKEDIPTIFQRFYRSEQPSDVKQSGTGIGLALAKNLMELHRGRISVTSSPGMGSCFTISLPLNPDVYGEVENQNQTDQVESTKYPHITNEIEVDRHISISLSEVELNENAEIILIVDDNEDIRTFIRQDFSSEYKIVEAENGQEGYKLARKYLPDLIIADFIMPVMNGADMARKLKNDELTSHIPIIMLTARTSVESQVDGFDSGADDYVIKPFSSDVLHARVKNIIASREKLRELFVREKKIEPKKLTTSDVDEGFLSKMIEIVEQNMNSPYFSVDFLAQELNMHRAHLYRKIKSLTSSTPSNIVKTIQLNKAAELILSKDISVTDVCYQVGFTDPKYFSKTFKSFFGVSPTDYKTSN